MKRRLARWLRKAADRLDPPIFFFGSDEARQLLYPEMDRLQREAIARGDLYSTDFSSQPAASVAGVPGPGEAR